MSIFIASLLMAASAPGPAAPVRAQADVEETMPSPEAILRRPEAVIPFAYATLVGWLWSNGRRQQAAFWFYVFQERTRPWADADTAGDGAAALRAALNDELGTVVNGWVGSDTKAWQAIVDRALSYEAQLPLADDRPDGLSGAEWQARVAKARESYVAAARETLFTMNAEDQAAKRRAAGLYSGPLQDPGPALPESWR